MSIAIHQFHIKRHIFNVVRMQCMSVFVLLYPLGVPHESDRVAILASQHRAHAMRPGGSIVHDTTHCKFHGNNYLCSFAISI